MIESEVLAILTSAGDRGSELNSLVDQYRAGRDSEDLLRLLHSKDNDLVQIGAYIAGEISFEHYNTSSFIDRLWELTNHEIPAIRFNALGALFPALDRSKQETRELIGKLLNDSNKGVRLAAESAARQLGIEATV
jgi:hypothetical protein